MRSLKFRAWDRENKCYFEPIHEAYRGELKDLSVGLNGRLLLRTIDGVADESTFPGRFIIEQYTGLHDKPGVEIYEGDILVWRETFPGDVTKTVAFGGAWNYAAFGLMGPRETARFDDDTKETWDLLTPNIAAHCEIIGTIHDTEYGREVD